MRLIRQAPAKTPCSVLRAALAPAEEDAATCFFLSNFATIGRDLLSTRGFFEMIRPIMVSECPGSAASLALTSLSTCLYTLYRAWPGSSKSCLKFGRALQQLQEDIKDPLKSRHDATLLAAMILQFYDNITAVSGLKKVERTHHDGALALLRHRGKSVRKSKRTRYLLGWIFHTEVSSAIRERRPLTEDDLRWLDYDALPLGPSPALDLIGISVANLQYDFLNHAPEDRSSLLVEAANINNDLMEWIASIPAPWRPYQLKQIKETTPPIIAYKGSCDIYPSVQVAKILNVWRCYRLIVLKISLVLRYYIQDTDKDGTNYGDRGAKKEKNEIQNAVDGICATVPFFLGNRRNPSTMGDFSDPDLELPSYHDIISELRPEAIQRTILISKEEHDNHVIAQGMWHVMSPLSHVGSLYSEAGGHLAMGCLREGQIGWIKGQLVRAGVLMRLPLKNLGCGGQSLEGGLGAEDALAEGLRRVEDDQWFLKRTRRSKISLLGQN